MKHRKSVLTLGVTDLARSLVFCRDGLGLPTIGIVGQELAHGAVTFFDLAGGLKAPNISQDTGLPVQPINPTAVTIGHNVARREEVNVSLDAAVRAGAKKIKPAKNTFYSAYAGYFSNPDGHLWEIVSNPDGLPSED